ncbi:MAG TPA: response regulator transcription factor [Actinomycetota bacterium]|nr:response regulator transcription factor [Actinomycetota bacterium]
MSGAAVETETLRVVLIDDHTLVRQSVGLMVGAAGGFRVVAEAGGADAGIAAVSLHRPDLVVLDIGLPGRSGLEVAAALKEAQPGIRIMFLTMHEDDATIASAVGLGADAYVLKSASTDELLMALRAVATGGSFLSPSVARSVMHRSHTRPGALELTSRELEIVRLLADGARPAQIAASLTLSLRTVRNHLANVYAKLGVQSAAQAVAEAYRRGLVARSG